MASSTSYVVVCKTLISYVLRTPKMFNMEGEKCRKKGDFTIK